MAYLELGERGKIHSHKNNSIPIMKQIKTAWNNM